MAKFDIASADTTGMDAAVEARSVDSAEQDAPGTRYTPDWSKWFGYYKDVAELQAVVNKAAMWTLGKGYEAESKTKELLKKIRGCGKDTFNDLMFNQCVAFTVGGDSFAEIIKNKRGELKNLKPINPGSLTIVSNARGIITGYEQVVQPDPGKKRRVVSFAPDEIFHLAWNRLGDEVHGRSTIEKLEKVILARNEAMEDMRVVFHRYVKPLVIVKADTDDTSEIAALKAKIDNATKNMENMVVPKDSVELERMSIPQYSTLDPLPWMQYLQQQFVMAEGVPDVIMGYGRDTTEASAKILYLAFQQTIEHRQRFLEAQLDAQLGIEVEFNFPADIAPDLAAQQGKARNTSTMPDGGTQVKEGGMNARRK